MGKRRGATRIYKALPSRRGTLEKMKKAEAHLSDYKREEKFLSEKDEKNLNKSIIIEALKNDKGNTCISFFTFKYLLDIVWHLNEGVEAISNLFSYYTELYKIARINVGIFLADDLKMREKSYLSKLKKEKYLSVGQFERGNEENLRELIEEMMKKIFGGSYQLGSYPSPKVALVACIGLSLNLCWKTEMDDAGCIPFWGIDEKKPQRKAKMFSGTLNKIGSKDGIKFFEINTENNTVMTVFICSNKKTFFTERNEEFTSDDLNYLKRMVFDKNLLEKYEVEKYDDFHEVVIPKVRIRKSHRLDTPSYMRENIMSKYIKGGVYLDKIYLENKFEMDEKGVSLEAIGTALYCDGITPTLTVNEPFIVSLRNKYGLLSVAIVTEPIWED